MLAKLRQAGHLLCDGPLHVMPGYALVIRNSLVVDQRAVGEMRSGHYHSARSPTIGLASLIVSSHRGLEIRDGFDGDRRARNVAKQLRQLWLHLCDVLAKVLEDLVCGDRPVSGVGLERFPIRREVGKAFMMRNDQTLRVGPVERAQTDLVYLVGSQRADGGAAMDVVEIALLTTGQRSNGERSAAVGRVLRVNESAEGPVRRQNFVR